MQTLGDLERAMTERGIQGVTLKFGPSVGQRGTWFANGMCNGEKIEQVRAATLSDALRLLMQPASDDLSDLLA